MLVNYIAGPGNICQQCWWYFSDGEGVAVLLLNNKTHHSTSIMVLVSYIYTALEIVVSVGELVTTLRHMMNILVNTSGIVIPNSLFNTSLQSCMHCNTGAVQQHIFVHVKTATHI